MKKTTRVSTKEQDFLISHDVWQRLLAIIECSSALGGLQNLDLLSNKGHPLMMRFQRDYKLNQSAIEPMLNADQRIHKLNLLLHVLIFMKLSMCYKHIT